MVTFESVALAYASLLGALVLAAAGLRHTRPRLAHVHARLRQRFILGVPWGSVLCIAWLLLVYLFVQRGYWHWQSPVIVSFSATSLFDPVGWLFASFAHSSPGHLRGNVATTMIFAPIVEYVWSHYPRSDRSGWEPWWVRRPAIRAFVLFPLGVGVVGMLTALFSWGPVIGFSIAAFAFVGCALIHYPVLSLVALLARSGIQVLWQAITDPIVVTETAVRAVRPGWFGVAVQGHLLGFLIGIIIGIALLRREHRHVDALRLWFALVLAGLSLSIWGVWWILGPEQFVLFRAVGVGIVILVATIVTLASTSTQLPVYRTVDLRRLAFVGLLVIVLVMGVVGIGLNLATVESPSAPPAANVGGFDIYYAEDIPDGMVGIVDLEGFGLTTDVRSSGVIVVSEERNVWRQMVSAVELENRGVRHFHVGGIGWSQEITVVRHGWTPVGNASTFQVWVGVDGAFESAFVSDPSTARPIVEDHRFTVLATDGTFMVAVEHHGETQTVPIPSQNESVSVHELDLVREDQQLIARSERSDVPIATRDRFA